MKRLLALCTPALMAPPYEAPAKITVEPYGYVRMNPFFDTRQVVGPRDTDFLFFPQPCVSDCRGKDLNDRPVFTMLPIETRVGWKFTGPDAFCAKAWALIETDFLGVIDPDIAGLRMRHAFFELDAERWKVRFGQYWHPFFVDDCRARTISFNLGAPYGPYAFPPQIRLTWKVTDTVDLIVAALSELEFRSDGPVGPDTKYIRNAVVPEFHLQTQVRPRPDILIGAAVDYKRLVPRLVNDFDCIVHESVNTVIAELVFAKNWPTISLYTELLYSENPRDLQMLGGYAVSSISGQDRRTYEPLRFVSGWIDVETTSDSVRPGLFIGFAKNFGTSQPIFLDENGNAITYGLGNDINYSLRISPRIWFYAKPVSFAAEIEVSTAAFGTFDRFAVPRDTTAVTNARFLLAGYYHF